MTLGVDTLSFIKVAEKAYNPGEKKKSRDLTLMMAATPPQSANS